MNGERVLFHEYYVDDDSIQVGDKLVRKGNYRMSVVHILNPHQYDEHYQAIRVDHNHLKGEWVCFVNLHLIGRCNIWDL